MISRTRATRLAAAALGLLLAPARAQAVTTDFVLQGGLNLSSPRTAASISLGSFSGVAAGFGFDINLAEHAYVEPDFLFVKRRYAGGFSMPSILIPLLLKFENRYLMVGAGPYVGFILATSADDGVAATPDSISMSTTDFGGEVLAGIKVPLTKTVSGFGYGAVTRALTSSYPSTASDTFYWGQVQMLVGLQIRVGRKR